MTRPDADDNVPGSVRQPACWLAWCNDTDSPGSGPEVIVVAPGLIQREGLSASAQQILDCAELYAGRRAVRLVYFSDLTRLLAGDGHSWAGVGVAWEDGLAELAAGDNARMFLTVSERAYMTISDPVPGSLGDDRRQLRQVLTRQLDIDWPQWALRALDNARARLAG